MLNDASASRMARITRVIGGVVHEALRVTGANAVVLLDMDSPEGILFRQIADAAAIPLAEFADSEVTLTAHPANKTALLVGEFQPRVDLLPLGDLYATQVQQLSDGWTGDDAVHAIAAALGGIDRLDASLQQLLEGRMQVGSLGRSIGVVEAARVAEALRRSRFRRARTGLVPKLGSRTIGVDLLD